MKKVLVLAIVIVALLTTSVLIGYGSSAKAPAEPTAAVSENNAAESAAGQTEAPAEPETEPNVPVDASWFSDAVFVGDSVTYKLDLYCDANPDALGGAQFFCAGSLSYANSLWDIDDPNAVHPFYKGSVHLTEECAEQTGAKKVFIMLGMNDIGTYGIDDSITHADELIGKLLNRTPDVELYIESVTPMLPGYEGNWLNNEKIREFDGRLKEYAEEHGYHYVDIYSVVCDENGYLIEEYCGDPGGQGIHFTDAACEQWIEQLKKSV